MTEQVTGGDAGELPVLREALDLFEITGWPIVPAHYVRADGRCSCPNAECSSPGKHPRFPRWSQRALRTAEAIRAHWRQFPLDNVGIATGSISGVVVLDVDGPEGEATLNALVAVHGALPVGPSVRTARGVHYYFAAGSVSLHNRAGASGRGLGAGLDIRAAGGFVIVPPSVHASGHVYTWAAGLHVGQVELPAVPDWITLQAAALPCPAPQPVALQSLATRSAALQSNANHGLYRYADAALRRECERVRSTAQGSRNQTLNEASFNMGTLIGDSGQIDGSEVQQALLTAALASGLGKIEAQKTIDSGLRAGMARPRAAPNGSNGHAAAPTAHVGSSAHTEHTHVSDEPAGPSGADVQPAPSRMVPRHDTQALFAPLPTQRWAVPGLQLGPGRPTLIVGYGASAKTWAGQALALAAAAGLPIFGRFPCSPMTVLHVDYEQGFYATCKRYQRLAIGMGVEPEALGNRLHYVELPRVYLDQKGGEYEFERACEGVDLLILDALRGAAPFSDENDSAFRSVVDSLTHVSQRVGPSVVALHHAGKPKKDSSGDARTVARGTSAIYDAAGCVLNFVALPGGAKLVTQVKMPAEAEGQALDPFEIVVEDIGVEGNPTAGARVSWRPHVPVDEATKAEQEFERHAALVLRAVRRVPAGQTSNEIVASCGVQRNRALDVLRALADMGRLETFKGPRGARVYRVVEP